MIEARSTALLLFSKKQLFLLPGNEVDSEKGVSYEGPPCRANIDRLALGSG